MTLDRRKFPESVAYPGFNKYSDNFFITFIDKNVACILAPWDATDAPPSVKLLWARWAFLRWGKNHRTRDTVTVTVTDTSVYKAKWESWSKLGNMTQEEAMHGYVNELHKIVETMAYSENVAEFLSAGDDEDDEGNGFPTNDLELVAGDVLARVRSESNSPVDSRSISPVDSPARIVSPSAQAAAHAHKNKHDSDDEFIDTVDRREDVLLNFLSINVTTARPLRESAVDEVTAGVGCLVAARRRTYPRAHDRGSPPLAAIGSARRRLRRVAPACAPEYTYLTLKHFAFQQSEPEAPAPRAERAAAAPPAAAACRDLPRLSNGHAHQITSQLTHLKVLEELPGTLARLERDVAALRKAVEGDRAMLTGSSRKWRWPWQELSPPTLLFVLLWPVVVARLVARRRRT
ncbi:Acyl-CoA-binding domain-containing protein 5 [Eumeta japonica]|uniref:Acyl-CoA-binding domain-containing protein 5 n=1 Tax=Eumeta variegata TaxID=151549 RepID=A0A4C1Y6P8_EUMVA|nr:Acyl-CoA-binding domain-containing protein 5 [Eumeta japonica]